MCLLQRDGHWKNEYPCYKGPTLEPNKTVPGKKTGWQPKPEAKDLIGLAGIESVEKTGLVTTRPTVKMKVGGQLVIFMVDSDPEHSVVTKPVASFTEHRATIVKATGTQTARQFCHPQTCQLGRHVMTHKFLYLRECPIPLLGRDLLTKLRAQITFNQGELQALQ
jgi:hypothetical protein